MAYAKRTVDKDLCFNGGVFHKGAEILSAHFTGADHSRKSRLLQNFRRINVVTRKLCACVELYGNSVAEQSCGACIGDDKSIGTCKIRVLCRAEISVKLTVVYQGICRNLHLYSVSMRAIDSSAQLLGSKVFCVYSCVKGGSAHVYRICAPLDRRIKRFDRARGSKKLGFSFFHLVILFGKFS